MKIKVLYSGQGKYGPYVKAGFDGKEEFMNLGKGLDLGQFPKNAEMDVETKVSDGGKHKIVKVNGVSASAAEPVVMKPAANIFVDKPVVVTHSRKERDFDAEAKGKTRCSMYAAALQSQALAQYLFNKESDLAAIKEAVREIAEDGVKYTFGE